LIFGVLRNVPPQIPGATFYDALIVGLSSSSLSSPINCCSEGVGS
jgi:hypothetical protein